MLYFKDAEGRTAWALPPFVDNLCEEREYLKYGRLNVQCFRQVRQLLSLDIIMSALSLNLSPGKQCKCKFMFEMS